MRACATRNAHMRNVFIKSSDVRVRANPIQRRGSRSPSHLTNAERTHAMEILHIYCMRVYVGWARAIGVSEASGAGEVSAGAAAVAVALIALFANIRDCISSSAIRARSGAQSAYHHYGNL